MPDAATAAAAAAGGPPAGLVLAMAASALLAVLVVVGAVLVVAVVEPRRRRRKRMAALGLTGRRAAAATAGGGPGRSETAARQRRIQEKLQALDDKTSSKAKRRNRIRLDLMQAGLDWDHRKYLAAAVGTAVAVMVLLLALGAGGWLAPTGGLVAGFGLPRLTLRLMARRRQKRFMTEFPNAIDVLVRGLRTGLPVGECLAIVGREMPEPVSGEFRLLTEGQRLGLTLDEIMRRALERMPTPEYRFFAIVLQIQQQTGGNLAETLANLSTVLRDRKKMRDKVKAMSSEAKSSAGIIGGLPFVVATAVYVLDPDYIGLLFTELLGNVILVGGLLYMVVGIFVMAKMINFRI